MSVIGQIALVATIFSNFDKAVKDLTPTDPAAKWSKSDVEEILKDARGALVFFLVCEIIALGLAVALRYFIPDDPAGGYDQWADAEAQKTRTTAMSGA